MFLCNLQNKNEEYDGIVEHTGILCDQNERKRTLDVVYYIIQCQYLHALIVSHLREYADMTLLPDIRA